MFTFIISLSSIRNIVQRRTRMGFILTVFKTLQLKIAILARVSEGFFKNPENLGDDALAIDSDYGNLPTDNITVRNMNIGLSHGLSLGARTTSGIQNVLFENIIMNGSENGPVIRAVPNWGGMIFSKQINFLGLIQNITYSNVQVHNNLYCCMVFEMNYTNDPPPPYNFTLTPKILNLIVQNFTCNNSPYAARIAGLNYSEIQANFTNVSLTNITNAKVWDGCKNLYGS